ncbi:MAG: SpoIID/LytB domain-containing protein, partial [Calditrichia bacterium]
TFDDILQKNHYSDQTFNGTIELRLDNQGNLMAISEVPLEKYLKRAIYSEVGTELPLEFLKSFAIVARSEAIARIKHKQLGESFDYCNTGHSLRYLGNDFEDENIEEAVESTRGQVLSTNDHIRDTPFHLVCGGHTEDASGIWGSVDRPFFKGRYDWKSLPKDFTTLKDEKMVRKWIESRPQVWCNLKGRKIPPALEKYKQYFRWELSYSRRELEEIIHKKTGEDVGTLFDIFPMSRGNSGRLSEIELIGSLKNYRIKGLFNIREALAYDYLPSSCFIIEKELDETGTPIMFTFIGAGQGHGVGLCKTGAAVMAYEGNKKCEYILKHYFQESNIRSIYEIDLKDKKK